MWNGTGSSRAVGIRTGYRWREPSQRTVALQCKIADSKHVENIKKVSLRWTFWFETRRKHKKLPEDEPSDSKHVENIKNYPEYEPSGSKHVENIKNYPEDEPSSSKHVENIKNYPEDEPSGSKHVENIKKYP